MTKDELAPIDTSKYKITETGQVLKMTKEENENEMIKDEMKDKISFALKDPILQQGFEIICENLAELEKENAELKEQCLILADCNTCHSTCSEIKKQLTKAKEIIKDYLTIAKGSHTTVCGVPEENRTIYVLKLNKEAEQFLKEQQK